MMVEICIPCCACSDHVTLCCHCGLNRAHTVAYYECSITAAGVVANGGYTAVYMFDMSARKQSQSAKCAAVYLRPHRTLRLKTIHTQFIGHFNSRPPLRTQSKPHPTVPFKIQNKYNTAADQSCPFLMLAQGTAPQHRPRHVPYVRTPATNKPYPQTEKRKKNQGSGGSGRPFKIRYVYPKTAAAGGERPFKKRYENIPQDNGGVDARANTGAGTVPQVMKITSQNMIHKCHVESVLSRALVFYSGTGRDILRTWGTLHIREPIPIINPRPITRKHAGQCQLYRHLLLSAAGLLYTTTALTLFRLKQPHPATTTPRFITKKNATRDKHSLDPRKRHHTILSPKPRKAIVLEQGFSCPLVCEVHQRQLSQKIIKGKCDRAVARFIITFVVRGSLRRSAGGGVLHPPTGATALLRPEVIS